MTRDSLGDRMKGYEAVPRLGLMKKSPVIIRVDGKAFHTLTRGMEKPYDDRFAVCMWMTAKALCEETQGCQLAYVQSDEISLLLVDYQTRDTQGWFDYQLQKIVSVSASIATAAFTHEFQVAFPETANWCRPLFDSRVFNLPRHEVVNYFIWRQQDATRNSIQGLAQANFSHKQLQGLNCDQLQEKLFQEKKINWGEDVPTHFKRGACVIKGGPDQAWIVDQDPPIFTQARGYVQCLVDCEIDESVRSLSI